VRLPARNESERVLFALAATAETKDAYSLTHPKRVANTAVHIGRRLGLSDPDLLALYRGGLTHDIGKIFVADAVLGKPGPLSAEEERQMREHPAIGERIFKYLQSAADILPIIRHHHERFDGGGYPDGLSGHQIPLLARIVSVSDAHDALSSDRPYRARRSHADVVETLMRGAGQQWDRELVSVFLSELDALRFELVALPEVSHIPASWAPPGYGWSGLRIMTPRTNAPSSPHAAMR
jgi:HD-GYP domain-containing protein (c-di-GMP phosphodiesterase class II)